MRKFTLFKNLLWLALVFVAGNAMAQTNLLLNAGFEDWTDGKLTEWTPTTTAGGATLSQSTDAREGSYSVLVAGTSSTNKRLAYKEITLNAGTYTFSFYAKSETEESGTVAPGYVPVTDGKVGNYKYGTYVNNLSNTEWTLVSYEFTLSAETTLNLVIMNSKNPGKNVLIDDASLTTADGGLVEGGGDTPEPDEPTDLTGDGTKENPYTIADVIALDNPSEKYWVKGVIVGYIDGMSVGGAAFDFSGEKISNTNLLLADEAGVNDVTLCVPVQLPSGAVRTALNLSDNPENLGKELLIYGSLEKYFSVAGIKSPSDYVLGEGGGDEPIDPTPVENYSYKRATTVESGKAYLIVAEVEGAYKVATPLTSNYGYLNVADAKVDGGDITLTTRANEFVFTSMEDGYSILASDARYLYQTGTYNSFNVSADIEDGAVWTVEPNDDGTFKITNALVEKYIQYSVGYTSYGSYADEQGVMPYLYELVNGGGDAIANIENSVEDAPVEVYTLGGVKVGDNLNDLHKGIYVVKQGNRVKKVIR